MEDSQIEKIFNETFAGCSMFYRDANIDSDLISRYEVNQILLERGFTDMSYKAGGLQTNLRYLIASSKGKNISEIKPDSEKYGHCLLQSNSFFKVLDIYQIGEKTQILLLNIPPNATELFNNISSNIEDKIIDKARQSLDDKINLPVILELESKEWKERTKYPIGMNELGEFFYQQ